MEQVHLAQIDRWLAEHRPDYYSLLNPPAQEYLFGAVRSTAGIVLPDSIRRFYEWHDGQEAGTFEPLMMNLTFMTLMEMATTHQMHQHVSMIDQWSEEHWQPSWVPFLSNGGGDYLCVAPKPFAISRRARFCGTTTRHQNAKSSTLTLRHFLKISTIE